MANSIFFDLRLRDINTGSVLTKFGGTAHSVFGGVDRDINYTQGLLNNMAKPINMRVDTSDINRAGRDIDNLYNKMNRADSGGGAGLGRLASGSFYGNLAARGVEMGVREIVEQGKSVLAAGMDADIIKAQFGVMAGGKQKGDALFNDLAKYIQDTKFGTELYDMAKTMSAFGVAVKDIVPNMKMLADVSLGDVNKMNLLAYAYSQTMSFGKLRNNEVMQYSSSGWNPVPIIAKMLGKKVPEVTDMISDNKIPASMVTAALKWDTGPNGNKGGMMEEMMKHPQGQWDAMMGNIDAAKMGLGLQELESEMKVMAELKPIIDDLPKTFAELKPQIDTIILGTADMVRWTRTHTDALGKFFGLVKVGVEAWAAWKVGTVALTGANWLWAQSTTPIITGTAAIVTEEQLLTEAFLEQTAAMEASTGELLRNAYAMKTWAAADVAAMDAMAANVAFGSATIAKGQAARIGAGSAALGGAAMGVVSEVVIPVAIAYFTGEAISQMMGKGAFGYKENGDAIEWWNFFEKNKNTARTAARMREAEKPGLPGMPYETMALLGLYQPQHLKYPWPGNYGTASTSDTGMAALLKQMSDEASSNIAGGGRKMITINLNQPLVGKQEFHVSNMEQALEIGLNEFREQYLRVLQGASDTL